MPIELKGNNYYSRVFKRGYYMLQNSMLWVVITPPNRHIASPLAMKERKKIKIKVINLQNHADHSKKCLSGMTDQTLTWNMKEIKLKLQ